MDLLNATQPEPEYGREIDKNVAESFDRLASQAIPKEKVDQLRKDLLPPANCKNLGVPRVNQEIWSVRPTKFRQVDFQMQALQQNISAVSVLLAKQAELLFQNRSKIPKEIGQTLFRQTIEAATINIKASHEINVKRKTNIRPCLKSDIASICNSAISSGLLFSENVCEQIKAAKSANGMVSRPHFEA